MISRGANDINRIAYYTVCYDYFDILYDIINRGVDYFDEIASAAAFDNIKCVVIDMINRGATNFTEIYEIAENYSNYGIVDYLIENNLIHKRLKDDISPPNFSCKSIIY